MNTEGNKGTANISDDSSKTTCWVFMVTPNSFRNLYNMQIGLNVFHPEFPTGGKNGSAFFQKNGQQLKQQFNATRDISS